MNVNADHLVPLLSHPTHVRWTSAAVGVLDPDELTTIQPLIETTAAELFRRAELLRRTLGFQRRNPNCAVLKLAPFNPPAAVAWVLDKLAPEVRPKPSDVVFVSWDPATAVRTQWSTFAEHWPLFCHAGTDDVMILPEAIASGDQAPPWVLYHHHQERFYLR